ncbi:MAG: aminotransferase class III-fold pyridoxal phosphate-dependent enzyme [Parasphingorhabdus sp.]
MNLPNQPQPDLIETDKKHVWHHLTQHHAFSTTDPLIMVEGNGMVVTDVNGREYLDATSGGLWSVNVGYGRKRIAEAVSKQLTKMCYFAGTGGTVPGAQFSERLIGKMPGMSRVYYSSSGSEANEKGYKMVRQRSHSQSADGKYKIIYRNRDYHGTTIGSLSSSGHSQRREHYGPFAPGFSEFAHCCCYRCPFSKTYGACDIECARDLERAILEEGPDSVGSVVLEPVTAGGGVITPVPEYFPIIEEICRKYDVLIHIDEVVCGFGRTGKWFGYQHFEIRPDIITAAKGTASGYAAIACTVTTERLFDDFRKNPADPLDYFRDVSTYGGCAGGHAAALENLAILEEEELVENAAEVGAYLMDGLTELAEKHAMIGDVRGLGLLTGVELVKDRSTREPVGEDCIMSIVSKSMQQGLLIGRTNRSLDGLNNTLYLTPALIADRGDIDQIIAILDTALQDTPSS